MDQYIADVKKYSSNCDQSAVGDIVNYLGKSVLSQRDASLVSCWDPDELQRVRENFCKKKLKLTQSDDEIDSILIQVCKAMSDARNKSRVTFYYLIAEKTETLTALA